MQAYIQYINKNGTIKAVEVERQEVGQKVHYVLPTIQEQFFILTVFDNNKRVLGLGFVDVENLDMLAFLNSDFQSVDALPEIAYFNAYQEIILETDLVMVQNGNFVTVDNISDFPQVQFPPVQIVQVQNKLKPAYVDENSNLEVYESDPDDLKYLKLWLKLNLNTLEKEHCWIEPKMFFISGSTDYYQVPPASFLYGEVRGYASIVDAKFGYLANQFAYPNHNGGNFGSPCTMTRIVNLDGSDGFSFKGYQVSY